MSAEADIRARLDRFVTDLTSLVRLATVAAFEDAFEAQRAAVGPASRAPARPRGRAAGVKRVRKGAAAAKPDTTALEADSSERDEQPRQRSAKRDKAQPPSRGPRSSKQLTLPLE